jgi:hypothetical protein
MEKLLLLTVFCSLLLSTCGGVRATVADDPCASESRAIVAKRMAAHHSLDAEALPALYSSDLTSRDCGFNINCDVERLVDLRGAVPLSLREPGFGVEAQSYMATAFGRFARLQVMYAEPEGGPTISTPTIVIPEFNDGMILNETWYYLVG